MAAQPQPPAPEFTLFGGEPLLLPAKPTVISLLQRVAARGHRANIITNGYSLAHFLDVFDVYHNAIESVQITLDGTEMDHNQRRVLKSGSGTFAQIVTNIDAFLNRDYATRCSFASALTKTTSRGGSAQPVVGRVRLVETPSRQCLQ